MPATRNYQPTCRCAMTKGRRLGCGVHGPGPREQRINCVTCGCGTFNLAPVCDPCADTLERMAAELEAVAS